MRFLGATLALLAPCVMADCGSDPDEAAEPPNEASRTPSQTTDATTAESADDVVETEEGIDIGGRSLHLECWGERVAGEPSVLLISGQGPTTSSWELMASEFAADGHHLCAYDRAGVGGSDPAPEASRTTEDQVTDLVALLDAADLQEPIVLAAHSLGSLPAVGLVDRAPERVAGVVLVDPWSPRVSAAQRAALPPEKPDASPVVADERRFLTDFLFDPAQNPSTSSWRRATRRW
jgi:pimeloyl-ACP methyl ester carboxylesterase